MQARMFKTLNSHVRSRINSVQLFDLLVLFEANFLLTHRMLKTCFDKLHDLCYLMIAHTYSFFLYQSSYYQIRIKLTDIMILKYEHTEFSVLSGRLIIIVKNLFPLYICRPNDYTSET